MFSSLKNLFIKLLPPPYLHIAFDKGPRNKPTILLLHGIAADSGTWTHLVDRIDLEKYRVVGMDLLGCGKSPRPTHIEYNIDDFVKSIKRTVKKARIKPPFIIMGHSMGALIAARYARLYPDQISSEYLLSIPIYHKNQELHTKRSRRQTDLFLKTYDLMIKNKDFTVFTFKIARRVVNIFNKKVNMTLEEGDWRGFSLSLQNTIIHQNTINDLKNTKKKIPIRIIYGNLDELLVQDNINHLSSLSNLKITRLIGVGHVVGAYFSKKVLDILYKDTLIS